MELIFQNHAKLSRVILVISKNVGVQEEKYNGAEKIRIKYSVFCLGFEAQQRLHCL